MGKFLNRIMYMVLTERNENRGEMTTEEFPVKGNRVWKGEEMEKCEVLSRNSFTRIQ